MKQLSGSNMSSLMVIRIGLTDLIGIDGLKMDYVGEAITPLNWVDFIYNDHTPEINENFRHNIDPYGDTSVFLTQPKSECFFT
ncbi:hypothetical protein RclHR1_17850002 [Rhizophagus clarus]|uniref:Uncharacterized protein n=1 Tax=Rhizophagus clarus TaxID=94130 RepID=A0A2Z6QYC0_9GLOM|nr:hypothetical protein RclHR1_17850002 [Rhizophagus clarus]